MLETEAGPGLWNRAKGLIPGGNQLLSKRAEMFLPDGWPSYYSRAEGCEIWDLDERHYYDFAHMGVGSCALGYADSEVNEAVAAAVRDGSMSTLNCPEEVRLAERLIELHPWSDMARFTRTGGEACAVAIRIARAATGHEKVAFCGYHGWHDWYLAANLADDSNLDGQLLPGLEPAGVPRNLQGSALPFEYNDLEALERIAREEADEIAAIIMEPVRSRLPEEGFLEGARETADRIGAVLIFDEITSGFRVNLGGVHRKFDVDPDVAIFGKALGNGFPIAAVIGRGDVMDAAQDSFISSTFWTERIGYAAALATLDKMEREEVPEALTRHGEHIRRGWRRAAEASDLQIRISGIPPLTHLHFDTEDASAVQTLFTQIMLQRGYLAGGAVYSTHAYTPELIDRYLEDCTAAFREIRQALEAGTIRSRLEGAVRHSGFERLT